MGGRGAASGMSDKGRPYGSQYRSVLTAGNIKFLLPATKGQPETLMDTMTKGRVYVLIDRKRNVPKSILFFDSKNKRSRQVDLDGRHGGSAHTHHGYEHNEASPNGKPTRPSDKDRKMIARVLKIWQDHVNGT